MNKRQSENHGADHPADRISGQLSMSRRTLLAGVGGAALAVCVNCSSSSAAQADERGRLRDRIAARRAGQQAGQAPVSPDTSQAPDIVLSKAGAFRVTVREGTWTDADRDNRSVPWRIYVPEGAGATVPVVIFSHGGGGTVAAAEQWGRHIASHGVASLHPQHLGSDRDAFRSNPRQIAQAAADPKLAEPRFRDIGFTLAQIKAGQAGPGLDGATVGIAGHSFGAITAQIIAGQSVTGYGQTLALPEIKAALALSPSPPRAAFGESSTAFANMLMPIFHVTGSEDDAPTGEFEALARREPFDTIHNVDQRLLWLDGANHFTFGGAENPELRGRSFSYPGLARHHGIIRAAMAAFWLEKFKRDTVARDFLERGLSSLLQGADAYEVKPA